MDESQPTKLVANDTSVVKIKDTLQLPITVDINKICSVRKHDRFKKQNLNKIEEEMNRRMEKGPLTKRRN